MAYIGTSPSNGVRRVHTYTATASQTTFSGASSEGVTLSYADTNYLDVYQNGILLGSADYTATSGTSVVLTQAASASDLVVIVVYDVFSVADTVSKANGGTFDSAVTVDGAFTSTGIDDNATSTAMTLDSSGNLLVGRTSNAGYSANSVALSSVSGNGSIFDGTGNTVAFFNRRTSDGEILNFSKDGTTVGSIGVTGTDILYVANPDGSAVGFNFDGDNPKINPCDGTGSGTDGVADLGHSGGRYKDLYLSGGAYLGGTGSANYLDDYEEGTWTAGFQGATVSATNTTGYYTKIGRQVFFNYYTDAMTISSVSGAALINGLPFTSSNASQNYGLFTYVHGTAVTGSKGGFVSRNATHLTFINDDNTTSASYVSGSNKYAMVSGFYFID